MTKYITYIYIYNRVRSARKIVMFTQISEVFDKVNKSPNVN